MDLAVPNAGRVTWRHFLGAVLGALGAFVVVLGFIVLYSVLKGHDPLAPFESGGTIAGFTGNTGLAILTLLDFIIPLGAGIGFVVALAVLSRWNLPALAFVSRRRALLDGLLLGSAVWLLFFVPVTLEVFHTALDRAAVTLLGGLVDHLAFGAVLVSIIYQVGGPVPFGPRPGPDPVSGTES